MKTRNKLITAILLAVAALFSVSNISAQCLDNVTGPYRTEVQSFYPLMEFTQWPGGCTGPGTELTGVGINQSNPQYMLDILCTSSTNQDVNISCPTCTTPNAVV